MRLCEQHRRQSGQRGRRAREAETLRRRGARHLGAGMSEVYALNLFNVANKEEYLAYSRRSAKEVQAHGGRVIALGKFREAMAGAPRREVLIVVEWASKEAFESYCNDPQLADLHPHR